MNRLRPFWKPWLLPSMLVCLAWLPGSAGALPAQPLIEAQPVADTQPPGDAAELAEALDRLQVLGSVLYLAAHPDDENTTLLALLSRGRHLRTGYLSLTRGGGGQNRIGTEQGDALAAVRTQELLAARRYDRAEQYFTRAVDFGFSKSAEGTLAIWGHEAALADVVWCIRRFRPDVVVTRFSPTRGGTHGHHTASAQLALEAFAAAGDPARFPEQLAYVRPWRPVRLLWNSYRPEAERSQAPAGSFMLEAGGYDPLLGCSFTELAALATSQHRSQGFGAAPQRGPRGEWFEPLVGDPAGKDLMDGIDCTWARVPGGDRVASLLARAQREFQPGRPAALLPLLLEAKEAMDRLAPDPWVAFKRAELVAAIRAAAGLWVEAVADRPAVAPGEPVTVTATVIARGAEGIDRIGLRLAPVAAERPERRALPLNQPVRETFQVSFPDATPCSQPYWLEGAAPGPERAGLAEDPPALSASFRLEARGVAFELTVPVRYRSVDPVLGERLQPLVVTPPVMVNLPEPVQVVAGTDAREVPLVLVAGRAGASGQVRLRAPEGWEVEPAELPFRFERVGDERRLAVRITPTRQARDGVLAVRVGAGGTEAPARGLLRIDYPHIPIQTLFPLAQARLVHPDLRLGGRRIGYVAGSGDAIPACLRPLGYRVELLSDPDLAGADLSGYAAIVLGVRAWNTRPALLQARQRLQDYVAAGGTEVALYNVDQGLLAPAIGPVPFRISRTRVTDPASPVTFLAPGHRLLNGPNRITQADFQGWVQERGSYFAEDLDPALETVLATSDAGEPPSPGGLVVARLGKGYFVYTGLSFFRQLPAGVPGAYRLFANLLALGQE
jgi:LmbE family N-acetylglucosaminyl deacetylase